MPPLLLSLGLLPGYDGKKRRPSACETLLRVRDHGRRKRIAVISATILKGGWTAQAVLAGKVLPAETPALTKEALLLLVDPELTASGITSGAKEAEFATAGNGYLRVAVAPSRNLLTATS